MFYLGIYTFLFQIRILLALEEKSVLHGLRKDYFEFGLMQVTNMAKCMWP